MTSESFVIQENKNGNECKEGRHIFHEWRGWWKGKKRVGSDEKDGCAIMIGVGCLESRRPLL